MSTYETDAALYANARDVVVEAWRKAHRQEFAAMMEGVMRDYHGELGGFEQRHNHCIRLVAHIAGFPCLTVWLNRPSRAAA